MPPVQTIYTEHSETCSRCNDSLHGRGSELPKGKDYKRKYLCKSCTGIRQDLEVLAGSSPDGIESAKEAVRLLEEAAQNPIFEAFRWGSRAIDTQMYDGSVRQAYNEIFQALGRLKFLLNETDAEQPWD